MAKERVSYSCSVCGAKYAKWQGKCFQCGAFDTLVLEHKETSPIRGGTATKQITPVLLHSVQAEKFKRTTTGISELDQVLGGGFVPGQVLLLGGEPGVGKSTLTIQVASYLPTLYVAGEESELQIKLRAERLGLKTDRLHLTRVLEIESVCAYLRGAETLPTLVIIDSIQSVYSSALDAPPGSLSQVQACAAQLTEVAKELGVMIVCIGQITKGGNIAGPKQLEHLVDTVFYLEGSRETGLRILRSIKNRFGPTDEVGVFQMTQTGMHPAGSVLKEMLAQRKKDIPGTVLTVIMEGNRSLLLEVQALNTPTQYGVAQRVINGIPTMRAKMLLAVLERRAGIRTGNQDIYINLSGGLRIDDPAIDLAVCLAVASVVRDKPLAPNMVAFGEVGLLGEIKPVRFQQQRAKEANKLGYQNIVSPDEFDQIRLALKRYLT